MVVEQIKIMSLIAIGTLLIIMYNLIAPFEPLASTTYYTTPGKIGLKRFYLFIFVLLLLFGPYIYVQTTLFLKKHKIAYFQIKKEREEEAKRIAEAQKKKEEREEMHKEASNSGLLFALFWLKYNDKEPLKNRHYFYKPLIMIASVMLLSHLLKTSTNKYIKEIYNIVYYIKYLLPLYTVGDLLYSYYYIFDLKAKKKRLETQRADTPGPQAFH